MQLVSTGKDNIDNIDKEVQNTALVTKEELCGEIQLKLPKPNVIDSKDEEESDEKPPSTKQMLECFKFYVDSAKKRISRIPET
jgi:hypothetical protein